MSETQHLVLPGDPRIALVRIADLVAYLTSHRWIVSSTTIVQTITSPDGADMLILPIREDSPMCADRVVETINVLCVWERRSIEAVVCDVMEAGGARRVIGVQQADDKLSGRLMIINADRAGLVALRGLIDAALGQTGVPAAALRDEHGASLSIQVQRWADEFTQALVGEDHGSDKL